MLNFILFSVSANDEVEGIIPKPKLDNPDCGSYTDCFNCTLAICDWKPITNTCVDDPEKSNYLKFDNKG